MKSPTALFLLRAAAGVYLLLLSLLIPAALAEEATEAEQGLLSGIEAFAQEPAMGNARVSPDGNYIATLQRFAKDGKQFVLIYDADDLSKKPTTLGSEKMDIGSVNWVNNDRLLLGLTQKITSVSSSVGFIFKLVAVDRTGENWLGIPRKRGDRRRKITKFLDDLGTADLFDSLPDDDNHILIEFDDDGNFVPDIFKVNVSTGSAQRIARNSRKTYIVYLDADGDPRLARRFDASASAIVYLARLKGKKDWIEIGRTVADKDAVSKTFGVIGLVDDDPNSNEFYILSNHESDTTGIYIYDLEKRQFGELQFRHPKYDAVGIRYVLDKDLKQKIVGFVYTGKASDTYFIDPEEKSLYDAINKILPDSDNFITSRSHDHKSLIIRAEGPRLPPSWYLLKNNRLDLLGQSRPFLKPEMLARVEWVSYKARDGMSIPAFVTIPNGEPPFPMVVLPHGGPVARDYGGFDTWAQMIAYHGYLVIQPQFRISTGFGRKHLEAGYAKWGYEMQDDLDDAITYLAERKLADPERAAIFGWSYGGYAAFVGSFRDPNPYKCAISGAGVADIPLFRAQVADDGDFSEKAFRPTMDGINPLDHVDSVDIPILVIHGDIDARVPVVESRKFVALLEKYNKQHKYIELEGANHFFGTIYYRHYMEWFPALIDWLDNTCGLKMTTTDSR